MSYGFTYGGVDFGALGLVVRRIPPALTAPAQWSPTGIPFADRAYSGPTGYGPRKIDLDCDVTPYGSTLKARLDAICAALVSREDQALTLDDGIWADRYWMARVQGEVSVELRAAGRLARLSIPFLAQDPFGYSTTETSRTLTIESDPDDFEDATGGTMEVAPVFVVTPSVACSLVAIGVEARDERLAWSNSLSDSQKLRIDCARQIVEIAAQGSNDWSASMANVTGWFPKLTAGDTNSIRVWGCSAGTLGITYRARYL